MHKVFLSEKKRDREIQENYLIIEAIRIETIMLSHKRDHPEKGREINPMFVMTIKGARRLGGKGAFSESEKKEPLSRMRSRDETSWIA